MNLVERISAAFAAVGAAIKSDRLRLEAIEKCIIRHSATVSLPKILPNGNYSFDVAIPGVTESMTAIAAQTATLGFGTVIEAVAGKDKVTVNIKSGGQLAAGVRTFNIRVIK